MAEDKVVMLVSADVGAATPDALVATRRLIFKCMANSDAFDSIRASDSIPLRARTLEVEVN